MHRPFKWLHHLMPPPHSKILCDSRPLLSPLHHGKNQRESLRVIRTHTQSQFSVACILNAQSISPWAKALISEKRLRPLLCREPKIQHHLTHQASRCWASTQIAPTTPAPTVSSHNLTSCCDNTDPRRRAAFTPMEPSRTFHVLPYGAFAN